MIQWKPYSACDSGNDEGCGNLVRRVMLFGKRQSKISFLIARFRIAGLTGVMKTLSAIPVLRVSAVSIRKGRDKLSFIFIWLHLQHQITISTAFGILWLDLGDVVLGLQSITPEALLLSS